MQTKKKARDLAREIIICIALSQPEGGFEYRSGTSKQVLTRGLYEKLFESHEGRNDVETCSDEVFDVVTRVVGG